MLAMVFLASCASSTLSEPATAIVCRVTSEWAPTETVEIPFRPDGSTDPVAEVDVNGQLRVRFFWAGGHLGVIAHDITGDRDAMIISSDSVADLQALANQVAIGAEVWDSGPVVHHTNRLQFRITCEAA